MANRHLSRSLAMQTLFEWDFAGVDKNADLGVLLKRNAEEFAPGLDNLDFAGELISGVFKHREKLDSIIKKAAPEWPLDQIAAVDRNVLRIGLCELLYGNRKEVPPKVAINESIELAKTFGGDTSGKFVNGVLGTVYREMGEPDSDTLKAGIAEEKLSGGVVYKKEDDELMFAFVHDVFGYWTLSKGKIEKDENPINGAKRKIKEEIGLDVEIGEKIGMNEYTASNPEKGKVKKIVTYFLAKSLNDEIKLKETGGLDDAKWFKMEELANLKIYDEIRGILAEAIKKLKK